MAWAGRFVSTRFPDGISGNSWILQRLDITAGEPPDTFEMCAPKHLFLWSMAARMVTVSQLNAGSYFTWTYGIGFLTPKPVLEKRISPVIIEWLVGFWTSQEDEFDSKQEAWVTHLG